MVAATPDDRGVDSGVDGVRVIDFSGLTLVEGLSTGVRYVCRFTDPATTAPWTTDNAARDGLFAKGGMTIIDHCNNVNPLVCVVEVAAP